MAWQWRCNIEFKYDDLNGRVLWKCYAVERYLPKSKQIVHISYGLEWLMGVNCECRDSLFTNDMNVMKMWMPN